MPDRNGHGVFFAPRAKKYGAKCEQGDWKTKAIYSTKRQAKNAKSAHTKVHARSATGKALSIGPLPQLKPETQAEVELKREAAKVTQLRKMRDIASDIWEAHVKPRVARAMASETMFEKMVNAVKAVAEGRNEYINLEIVIWIDDETVKDVFQANSIMPIKVRKDLVVKDAKSSVPKP